MIPRLQLLASLWRHFGVLLALSTPAMAQDGPTPAEAVNWALADQVALSEADRPFQRYLWIPPWGKTDSWPAAGAFAINAAASQSAVLVAPRVIAGGWMLAVDLRTLATDPDQLARLITVWDSLASVEPYFHISLEKTVVTQQATRNRRGQVIPQETAIQQVAMLAPHIAEVNARLLAEVNVSPALVYRLDWFLTQLLDVRYYDFMQFGGTLESVLATIGVDEELSKAVNGDQRVAIFASGVTGKPRRIDRYQGASGRFNTGAVWITRDLFDETARVSAHPIYNLLAFQVDGSEVIFERPNGLHGFVLVNANNKLVRKAPPNLVSDHRIPAPHTRELRPAISCIRCHGPAEGLQSARNDVRQLVLSGAIDVFDDFGNVRVTRESNIERLAGLYAGDFSRRILLGRDDYSLAVRRVTGQAKPEGLTVPELSELVADIYNHYVYDPVDPAVACRELGYALPEDPVARLRQVLPALPPDESLGLTFEDPTAAALKIGIPVRRVDFERIYPVARLLTQSQETRNVENN